MVHEINEVDDLTSSLSRAHDNNVAADSNLVGTDVSGAPAMDVVPIQIVSPADNKVEVTKGGGEGLNVGVPDDGGDVNVEEDEEANAEEDNSYLNDESDDEDEDDDDVDDSDDDDEEEYDEEDVYGGDFMVEDEEDDMDEDEEDDMDEDGGVENKVDNLDENEEEERTVEGESAEKEHEDKGGVSLERKVEKLKKKKVIKKVVSRGLDKVIVQNKDKLEGDEKNDPVDEEKGNKKEEVEETGGGSLKKNIIGSRQGDRKKFISGSSEKAATKPMDKLNSKLKKKGGSGRAESMGMIFMCSSKTKKDCYRYHVLGLPAGKRDIVEKIYKGMRLFLYDVDLKLLYGIYKAAGRGGYNIEPKAFNSKFPSQVRFTVLEDCLPLAEEKFRKIIKDNYFTKNKFDCQLKHEQVKNLCKLFLAASKGSKSKRLDRSHKAKVQASIHRDRSRAHGVVERRRSGLDENHRHRDYFHVRQREVSPVARVSQVAPLPPPIAAPRYGYDRALERDAYRQDILVEHRDPYRQPLLASWDAYRRQPLSEYRDVYRQEPVLDRYDGYRRGEVLEHHDLRSINQPVRHRDEIATHDPYGFYRERQSYRDTVYPPAEPDRYPSAPTEYRSRGAPISDYPPTRALYRY